MLEKTYKDDKKYVSCIKIDGIPILPPVITSVKRKELLKYKHQAIKLEKRLKRERELREYINRYYLPKLEETSILTESLEHKLSFLDDDRPISVTLTEEVGNHNHSKLTCDLQVSQYTNNEFKVLTSFENQPTHVESFIEDFLKPQANNAAVDGISEDFDLGKPRLIRSNSYVLETPSPLLLEHLKRHSDNDVNAYLTSVPTKEVFTSTPNDEVLDKLNTSKSDFFSETDSELKNISDNSTQEDITVLSKSIVAADNKEVNEQSADSISDDPISECLEKKDYSISLSSIQDLSLDPHDQDKLANILNAIPEAYSKQILELLDKQKQEQMIRLNSYMKIKETFLTVGDVPTIMDPLPTDKIQPEKSAYYTPESFMSPTTNENNNFTYHIDIMNDNNIVNNAPKLISQKCEQFTVVEIPKSCTRRLFAYQKSKDQDKDKKNWAATIIQANIKGYLTRRLLKTVRVQGLIQTIKDALMCAMELHSENVDNINESDVELHRRLIQQVSAAVYAFYDVFFKTTISEKMVIIRTDRERIKEKLKRPRSKASSISSRTTKSSRLS